MMVEPAALKGKIVHRLLHSNEKSFTSSNTRKRPRTIRNHDHHHPSLSYKSDRRSPTTNGLIFIPNIAGIHSSFPDYVLSLPQHLQKLGCYAAIWGIDVVISRYVMFAVDVKDSSSELDAAAKYVDDHVDNNDQSFGFVEVYEMQLAAGSNLPPQDEPDKFSHDYWTLARFRHKEFNEFESMKAASNTKRYKIVATVDAISPIINADQSRPFAMVELYDSNSEDDSCVVILKGPEALTPHASIFPGDQIRFQGLLRKRWQVPETFQRKKGFHHLVKRVPSYVFVADALDNVSIEINQSEQPLPTTLVPLVSVEGTVGRIEYISIVEKGRQCKIIDWVELSPNEQKCGMKFRIHMADYPITTAAILSIRTGSQILAVNVHPVGWPSEHDANTHYKSFGACLRSTITLVRHAPMDENLGISSDSMDNSFDDESILCTQPESSPIPSRATLYSVTLENFVPLHFCKTHRDTYERHLHHGNARNFLRNNFQNSDKRLPTVDMLVEALHSEVESVVWKLFFNTTGLDSSSEESQCGASFQRTILRTEKLPKKSHRDAYAEFFDHAASLDELDQVNSCDLKGCAMSPKGVFRNVPPPRPHLLGLHDVRSAGLQLLSSRLLAHESSTVSKGWNGSIHLSDKDLIHYINQHQQDQHGLSQLDSSMVFSGGIVAGRSHDGSSPVSLSDKHCCIPSSFVQSSIDNDTDFVVGQVHTVVLSCICIASLSKEATSGDETGTCQVVSDAVSLPFSTTLEGCCSLLLVRGEVYVASVHIRFKQPIAMRSPYTTSELRKTVEETGATVHLYRVRDCLESPNDFVKSRKKEASDSRISGLLLRKRFAYSKLESNGLCKGCRLTLSNFPVGQNKQITSESSSLQSLQLKLSVPVVDGDVDNFKRSLARFSRKFSLTDEQMALGVCWWTLAYSGSTSPIVCGGWDDLVEGSGSVDVAVRVSLPTMAISVQKCGFVRAECRSNEIEATYYETTPCACAVPNATQSNQDLHKSFDFVSKGNIPVVNGMVCKRVQRRLVFGPKSPRRVGEMIDENHSNDVPAQSLASLFRRLCRSLNENDPSIMSPDLVFQLEGARFLGVSFCQVECVCTRCYKHLIPLPGRPDKPEHDNARLPSGEPSFWHLPHPGDERNAARKLPIDLHQKDTSRKSPCHSRHHRTMKRCPNGCPKERYGLQWECSGEVEDGFGQAKLYAERDTALTLLGMDPTSISQIEEGVWYCEKGSICFNKSSPPSQGLQKHINSALSLCQQGRRGGGGQQQQHEEVNPLRLLSPAIRAEYLLQYYCRNSKRPCRRLDYFVNCKPLPIDNNTNVQHLKHTKDVEAYFQENAKSGSLGLAYQDTYKLPVIQLRLVDSCVATAEGGDDNINDIYAAALLDTQEDGMGGN